MEQKSSHQLIDLSEASLEDAKGALDEGSPNKASLLISLSLAHSVLALAKTMERIHRKIETGIKIRN